MTTFVLIPNPIHLPYPKYHKCLSIIRIVADDDSHCEKHQLKILNFLLFIKLRKVFFSDYLIENNGEC